ncbi:MAG: 5-oxoprolinase subunit PxpB [Chloroflexi bacterium]|jgi:inhibitor of KinA|nr:5-oxoprolinase subunit PxpB [Chloroflexota bacterium]
MATNEASGTTYPRLVPAGDSAIVIELGSEIDPNVNDQIYSLVKTVEMAGLEAVRELVPTYRSLLVSYDPLVSRFVEMNERLAELVDRSKDRPDKEAEQARIVELPVVYGGDDGPDLDSLAEHTNLSVQEVIDIHSGIDYRVYMIGFAPGFPYLGGLDQRIAMPRLKTPRVSVPAGSVGIAESQTGVYPNASPGGWQLIGRTLAKLFDVSSKSPSLITPGSKVRFVSVKSHDR